MDASHEQRCGASWFDKLTMKRFTHDQSGRRGMKRIQIYLREEELEALREAAARSGRSVSALVRDAIRQVVCTSAGPVAIWDGQPRRMSMSHDSVHDEV